MEYWDLRPCAGNLTPTGLHVHDSPGAHSFLRAPHSPLMLPPAVAVHFPSWRELSVDKTSKFNLICTAAHWSLTVSTTTTSQSRVEIDPLSSTRRGDVDWCRVAGRCFVCLFTQPLCSININRFNLTRSRTCARSFIAGCVAYVLLLFRCFASYFVLLLNAIRYNTTFYTGVVL